MSIIKNLIAPALISKSFYKKFFAFDNFWLFLIVMTIIFYGEWSFMFFCTLGFWGGAMNMFESCKQEEDKKYRQITLSPEDETIVTDILKRY